MQSLHLSSQAVLSEQRRSWFVSEMQRERRTFTNEKNITLFAGTWNVNGRSPDPNADISAWLLPPSQSGKPLDAYMLGLQEIQPLTGVDAVRSDPSKAVVWRKAVLASLGSDYDIIAERQLVGIFVMVFLRKNHSPFLSNVQVSYAATGFLNAVGNKGGVAVRFMLYDRTIACVACHLAAHTANVDRRTQDFTDVVRKAVFLPVTSEHTNSGQPSIHMTGASKSLPESSALSRASQNPSQSDPIGFSDVAAGTSAWLGSVAAAFSDISAGANTAYLNDPNAIKVLDHDVVFWLGDLNYRIDAELNQVLSWIKNHDWAKLFSADQLQHQMRTNDIFMGFREGPLRFPPTYKYERFSNEYAADENGEMKRVPAYTDRILWRVGTDDDDPRGMPHIRLDEYASATSVYSSDHRPVFATFTMTVGVEDVGRKRTAEEKINRDLDRREASIKPSLQFSSNSVDLGDVFFDQECSRQIVVRNVGSLTSFFSVTISNPPPWLYFDLVRWQNVDLPPGKMVTIPIRVGIDEKDGLANLVASQGCQLQTTLHLSGEPGNLQKKFEVHGRYVPTVLGLSLESLSMLAEPVISLHSSKHNGRDGHHHNSREFENERRKGPGLVPLSIPKEIWLLVDALLVAQEGDTEPYMSLFPNLFLKRGDESQVQRALSFVDRGERLPEDVTGYAIGTCLLRVLEFLNDSVVPRYAFRRAIEAGYTQDEEVVCGLVDQLPPLNRNVFWYIIGFLCELPPIWNRDDRSRDVAAEFGKVLIRSGESSSSREVGSKTSFVMAAINHYSQSPEAQHSVMIDLSNPETHPRVQHRVKK